MNKIDHLRNRLDDILAEDLHAEYSPSRLDHHEPTQAISLTESELETVRALIWFHDQVEMIATDPQGKGYDWGDVAELFSDFRYVTYISSKKKR